MTRGKAKVGKVRPKATSKGARKSTSGHTAKGLAIIAALEEFRDDLKAGVPLERKYRVTYDTFDFKTPEYGPADVKRVRESLQMSQANFAAFLGVDTNTVQSWEQGARNPLGTARRMMQEVEADPGYWRKRLAAFATATTGGAKKK